MVHAAREALRLDEYLVPAVANQPAIVVVFVELVFPLLMVFCPAFRADVAEMLLKCCVHEKSELRGVL